MNGDDGLRTLWRGQATKEMPEMTIEALQGRSGRLARKVSTRKWAETVAGGASMVVLAAMARATPTASLLQVACVLLVVGEAVVIANMWRRSAHEPAPIGATTAEFLAYYRGELAKERDRLWTIARGYLAPVAPGLVLLFIGVCLALGVWTPVVGAIVLGSTALTYVIIVALHRRAARRIGREIEALEGRGA